MTYKLHLIKQLLGTKGKTYCVYWLLFEQAMKLRPLFFMLVFMSASSSRSETPNSLENVNLTSATITETVVSTPIVSPSSSPWVKPIRLRKELPTVIYVYHDDPDPKAVFVPIGFMGDFKDLHLELGSREHPKEGKTCIKVAYAGYGSRDYQWAGLVWELPGNEWRSAALGGYDLSGMTRLTFWARGAQGGEIISLVRMGGIIGHHRDSGSLSRGPITLTNQWKIYTMDLTTIDLSHIAAPFGWTINRLDNPNGATFFLDEIRFEK